MQLIKFNHFGEGVKHAFSTKFGGGSKGDEGGVGLLNIRLKGGDSKENTLKNIDLFLREVGANRQRVAIAHQEHTDNIVVIDNSYSADASKPFEAVDAFVTDVPGIALMVRFADCQGVLFYDPVEKVIAAVHSGWRGNVQNIIGKTIRKMAEKFDSKPANIKAAVGQSLGLCCSEFSDPFNELPEFIHKYIKENNHVDLWQCAEDQILAEGVLDENLRMLKRCTVCEAENFFSFRREKEHSGHMAAVIELS